MAIYYTAVFVINIKTQRENDTGPASESLNLEQEQRITLHVLIQQWTAGQGTKAAEKRN